MTNSILSTQEVAVLLRVTETTIKRWADEGKIHCIKTLGRHRKFTLKDVVAFAEKNGFRLTGTMPPPMNKEQMEQLQFGVVAKNYGKISQVFLQEALEGDREGLLELLLYIYKHHISLTTIADEVIRPALVHIGEMWQEGALEVNQEHRASQAITEAFIRFAPEVHRKPSNSLSAVCACPEGELHEFGLRCTAYALESEGWNIHYIGANTPFDTLSSFIKSIRPDLVCLSFTIVKKKSRLLEGLHSIGTLARSYDAKLVVGGFYSGQYSKEDLGCDYIASSTGDIVAYTRDVFHLKPGPKTKEPVTV